MSTFDDLIQQYNQTTGNGQPDSSSVAAASLSGDDLKDRVAKEAQARGLPKGLAESIIGQESNWDADNKNSRSSAQGIFQLMDADRKNLPKNYTQDDEINFGMNKIATAYKTAKNALGREPTFGEAYVPYWQGVGAGKAILSNPDAPLSDTLEGFGKGYAQRVLTANPDMQGLTTNQDFIDHASGLLGKNAGAAPKSDKLPIVPSADATFDQIIAGHNALQNNQKDTAEQNAQKIIPFATAPSYEGITDVNGNADEGAIGRNALKFLGSTIQNIGHSAQTVAQPNYDWAGSFGTIAGDAAYELAGGPQSIGKLNAALHGQGPIPLVPDTGLGAEVSNGVARAGNFLNGLTQQITPGANLVNNLMGVKPTASQQPYIGYVINQFDGFFRHHITRSRFSTN